MRPNAQYPMRLEYFQLIDRVVDLNLADRTITCDATVPTKSTIFEGHFPGYPLMPGVLLIEAMAQTSGWLLVALNRFERMPFLAAVKEAKLRTFVTPGQRPDRSMHGWSMTAPAMRSPKRAFPATASRFATRR